MSYGNLIISITHKPLSLSKNFSWALNGSLISAGCQWAMLMVMTKLLSVTEVGYYALALAITAPVVLISMLQLRSVQVSDAQHLNRFEDFFGTRLVTNCIAILIVLAILIMLSGRYDFRVYAVIFIVAVNKIIEATSDIAYGLMQKHERMDKVAQSMILRNAGAFICLAAVLKFTGGIVFGLAAIGLWWLCVLFFFDRGNVKKFGRFVPQFHIKSMLSIIRLGLPLGIVMAIINLNSNIPSYFVEAYLGSKNLAFFATMAYVAVGASQITVAIGESASARLAQYYISSRKAYIKLLRKMLAAALILAFGAVMFSIYLGRHFLLIVYTPEYAEQQDAFVWLMVAAAVAMSASMLGYGITAARRFKSQIPVSLAAIGVCLLTCWLLIPQYGIKGAALAMLAASITKCLAALVVIMLVLKSDISANKITAGS